MTPAAAHSFVIRGAASAQLPLRLLNFFAQQDILPDTVCLIRADDGIAMRIVETTLDNHRAAIILAKMQALFEVAWARFDDPAPIAAREDQP